MLLPILPMLLIVNKSIVVVLENDSAKYVADKQTTRGSLKTLFLHISVQQAHSKTVNCVACRAAVLVTEENAVSQSLLESHVSNVHVPNSTARDYRLVTSVSGTYLGSHSHRTRKYICIDIFCIAHVQCE